VENHKLGGRALGDLPFLGSAALAAGELTRGRLRGPGFRRMLPDVYQPAGAPLDLRARSLAAFHRVRERGGVLAGYSAAELHGAHCAPLDAPAEVIVDWDLSARAGLRVHRDALRRDEVVTVAGCQVTSPLRTAYDLARWSELVEGVVAMDALAGRFGFPPDSITALRRRGARNGRRLDEVIALADRESESPLETRSRLLLVLAGLPPPVSQHPVPDANGHVVGWLDLAYPAARLGIECDGEQHLERARRAADRRRDARMARLGWQVLRFGTADVLADPERTVALVRDVLGLRTRSASSR
jgi:hypothetical protein